MRWNNRSLQPISSAILKELMKVVVALRILAHTVRSVGFDRTVGGPL
jgi:hypothetical protein